MRISDLLLIGAMLPLLLAASWAIARASKPALVAAYITIAASLVSLGLTLAAVAIQLKPGVMTQSPGQTSRLWRWLPLSAAQGNSKQEKVKTERQDAFAAAMRRLPATHTQIRSEAFVAGRAPPAAENMTQRSVANRAVSIVRHAPDLGAIVYSQRRWGQEPAPRSPGLAFGIRTNALALTFFLLVLVLHLLTAVYTLPLARQRAIGATWFAWTNLLAFAILAQLVSSNLIELYGFLALAGVAAFGLTSAAFRPIDEPGPPRGMLLHFSIGDVLVWLGVGLLLAHWPAATLNLGANPAAFPTAGAGGPLGPGWPDWMGLCLLAGALAKAGQFPFHTWPAEMGGAVAPANALLTGGLMSISGCYLLTRLLPLLDLNVRLLAAMAGAISLAVGASVALVQTDLKRVLAWLSVALLGLVFLLLAAGAYGAGLYQAVVTALGLATLFLVAGSVLDAANGELDLRFLGALWTKLPVTAVAALLVLPAITPLIPMAIWAHFGPAGLTSAWARLRQYAWAVGGYGHLLFWTAVLAGYLLPLVMGRWWWLAFGPRAPGHAALPTGGATRDRTAGVTAESRGDASIPRTTPSGPTGSAASRTALADPSAPARTLPILVLTACTLLANIRFVGLAHLLAGVAPAATASAPPAPTGAARLALERLAWAWPTALVLVVTVYFSGLDLAEQLRRLPGLNLLHRWLSDGMFFGDFHRLLLGRTIRVLAQTSAFFDRWILGGLLVAGALAARLLALAVAWLEREF